MLGVAMQHIVVGVVFVACLCWVIWRVVRLVRRAKRSVSKCDMCTETLCPLKSGFAERKSASTAKLCASDCCGNGHVK